MLLFTRIIVALCCLAQLNNCYEDDLEVIGVFPTKHHSLLKPFQSNGMTVPHWNFFGGTIVTSDYIRLTPDQPGRRGGVWNNVPLESPYWEIHLQFKIRGSSRSFSGDGMAFWYTTEPIQEGDAFGSRSRFTGLSVMFDTYANTLHKHTYPYISVMINNGSLVYDHDKDGVEVSYGGCEALFRGVKSDTFVLIRYDHEELSIKTDIAGKNEWSDCLHLSGVRLPSHGYLGVSASTGDLSDNHDILMLRVHELEAESIDTHNDVAPPMARRGEDRRAIIPEVLYHSPTMVDEHAAAANKMSSLSIFLIIFFTMLAIIFLAAVAYLYYQNRVEQNRKRFY